MVLKIVTVFVVLTILSTEIQSAPQQSNQLAMNWAQQAADSSKRPGQPQFHVNGGGAGNSRSNWGAGGNLGVATKVWESKNQRHSLGAGVNYQQYAGRYQGQSYKSPANVGYGASYRYRFGG